ncbi:hypothetical protein GCM10020258_50430 [Sphingomonas yabuuchiae]
MLRSLVIAAASFMAIGEASASPVLLVSLDGLRPDDVRQAKARGLKLPVLSALAAEERRRKG